MSLTAIYGRWIEPYQIEIHHLWIQDEYFGKVFGRKILVQLSDLHINKIGRQGEKVLQIIDRLDPDIIFLTGDYAKWQGDYEDALAFLSQLKAKIGIWGILGDYDYSDSRKSCLFCHEANSGSFTKRHQVHFLRNSSELINLPNGSIRVEGIDPEKTESFPPEKSLQLFKKAEPAVVLSHNPLLFKMFDKNQHIFMLAGDTHGGQFALPSWLWNIIGYKKNAAYSQGLFEEGNKRMFVTRGIGTSHIPIRLFRRPEVVVLHFVQ